MIASRAVPQPLRRLCVVLGDQLDHDSAALDGFDPDRDAVLMTEAVEEATYVAQHKKRLVLFFSAMRHFAAAQAAAGRAVIYSALDAERPAESLAQSLRRAVEDHAPQEVLLARPGDWRVLEALKTTAEAFEPPLRILPDRHFLFPLEVFETWIHGRRRILHEDFYRFGRKRTGWLMDDAGAPVGGEWNFDKLNRKSFGREGPGLLPQRLSFPPDEITRAVVALVCARFPQSPGRVAGFEEPVTRAQALAALEDFIDNRLPLFGDYQDAIAKGRVTLHHARLSAALNLKLLNPQEVCAAALKAYAEGRAPLNAVEGFVRQILGWREFVRGVYWTQMPDYAGLNHLGAERDVPAFFWTGETEMACLQDALGGLVETGYAHHIQRLMVMGLFLLLYGARPYAAHEWHMAMYLDAVDWVSLPNVLGMSQHGDGGVVGAKPYAASGAYIDRMSDCCAGCRFDPKQAVGESACPFTTLYWDFLDRHEPALQRSPRMRMQLNNLARKSAEDRAAIRRVAELLAEQLP